MSAFDYEDRRVNPLPHFWQVPTTSVLPEGFTGTLHQKSSDGFDTAAFVLSQGVLYRASECKQLRVTSQANVQWKLFEPFYEDLGGKVSFGFKLQGADGFEDFYCKSSEVLELWFIELSAVCLMSDIKDDYNLAQVIGQGAFATVRLAYAKHDSSAYAVKTIKKKAIELNLRGYRGVASEIEIMKSLTHPNLVKLHRVYNCEDRVCLVMDYVPYLSLAERALKFAPFSEEQTANFARSLLEALQYVHSQRVVHRDIKPENILMMSSRPNELTFKIADFGLAARDSDSSMNMICGSPGFIAPEVLKHQHYNYKADIFSVGVVLYVM
jgi:tRNA A-37 threonylcarbamoyl transferase component Bud32